MKQGRLANMQGADWQDLRVLLAVAQAGSFARAATALGVHETTVARQIRRLERTLRQVLWRGPDAGLTDEGAALVKHAATMADAAAMGQAEVAGAGTPRGAVLLTAVPWVVEAAILPAWAAWRSHAPGTSLSVSSRHDSLNLLQGEADIALRFARPEEDSDIVIRKLGDVPFVVTGQGPDWVGYVPEMAHLPQAGWTQEDGNAIIMRLSDQAAVTRAVASGLGRAWVPACVTDAPDPGFGPRTRPLWCLTHPSTRNAPAVRALCDDFLPLVTRTLCR
jgi:DNA-binding transcriptional LysR family regulator